MASIPQMQDIRTSVAVRRTSCCGGSGTRGIANKNRPFIPEIWSKKLLDSFGNSMASVDLVQQADFVGPDWPCYGGIEDNVRSKIGALQNAHISSHIEDAIAYGLSAIKIET